MDGKLWQVIVVPDVNHLDIVVWAVACTGRAPDACRIIDDDLPTVFAVNGPGRAWDHADWIVAMQAGLGNLNSFSRISITDEPGIPIVG